MSDIETLQDEARRLDEMITWLAERRREVLARINRKTRAETKRENLELRVRAVRP